MPNIYLAPTANFVQKTLNGTINDAATTITLNNTTNLTAPGYAVIDRQDSAGTNTPNAREVISYTGISGNDLTGVTRGADSSTQRSHNDGAIVEFSPTIGMWNNLATVVSTAVTADGYLKAISSPVSIAIGRFTQFDTPSIASITRIENKEIVSTTLASLAQAHITRGYISTVTITTLLNASGASIVGSFGGTGGFNALFQVPGSLASQANIGGLIMVPTSFTASFIHAAVATPASLSSVGVHILKNNTVFGVCEILAATTYASSASIGNTALVAGDRLTMDIRSTASLAGELSVMLRAT